MTDSNGFKDEWSHLTERIIGSVFAVHNALGPGYLEAIYHKALIVHLRNQGYHTSSEVEVPIHYLGVLLGRHRLDLVVAGQAVVELKAVAKLDAAHFAQVRSYLASSNLPVGLLVNFSGPKAECRRVYPPQQQEKILKSLSSCDPALDHPFVSVAAPVTAAHSTEGS